SVFGSQQGSVIPSNQSDLVCNHVHTIEIVIPRRPLRIPVLSAVIRMKNHASRSDHPAAIASKTQVEQLSIRATMLLAPRRASVGRNKNQSSVSDDVDVIVIGKLNGVEIK